MSTEIRKQFNPATKSYDFAELTTQPFMQSFHAEAARLYASGITVRVLTSPAFALDDRYTVTKGTTMLIYNRLTALYTPGWTDARPHMTSRPLTTFWAERFLTADKAKGERFREAGLVGTWTSYGGGEHWCPGRQFARNIGIATLAVLLGDFEVELVGGEALGNVVPVLGDAAFGKVEPTKRIAARLRKRQK